MLVLEVVIAAVVIEVCVSVAEEVVFNVVEFEVEIGPSVVRLKLSGPVSNVEVTFTPGIEIVVTPEVVLLGAVVLWTVEQLSETLIIERIHFNNI